MEGEDPFTGSGNWSISAAWVESMIAENVRRILKELPAHVELVGAAKTRTVEEILEVVKAGLRIVGRTTFRRPRSPRARRPVRELAYDRPSAEQQSEAVEIFDMIETVDTPKLAAAIDQACRAAGKSMPVLVEINSAEEPRKTGVSPAQAEALIREIALLEHVRVMGLMTMGPLAGMRRRRAPFSGVNPPPVEEIRALRPPGVEMEYLSMGMSDSYHVAIQEEGANLVRIGTLIFGQRGSA